jgi:hypothetical protein
VAFSAKRTSLSLATDHALTHNVPVSATARRANHVRFGFAFPEESRFEEQNDVRQKTHFACRLNTITPVQSSAGKYSAFCFSEIHG